MSLLMKALKKAETGNLAIVEPVEPRVGRSESRVQDPGASAAAALLLAHGRRTRRERVILLFLVLAVVAAAAIGTYIWYQVRPNSAFNPAPEARLANVPAANAPIAPSVPAPSPAAPIQAPVATESPVAAEPTTVAEKPTGPSTETPVGVKATIEKKRETLIAPSREPTTGGGVPTEPSPHMAAAPIEIQVSESGANEDVRTLEDAYNLLRRGKLDDADQRYSALLLEQPSNVDAWLGRATIAGQRGNRDQAREYYRRALAIAPTNTTAQAGLLALESAPSAATEDEIKRLIQQAPSASLYFTLGNAYGGTGKWSEAQAAYFDAFRLDNKNPDYAFNLAVSLEHLGQTKPALDYYQRALQLAEKQPAHFSSDRAAQRIAALQVAERP